MRSAVSPTYSSARLTSAPARRPRRRRQGTTVPAAAGALDRRRSATVLLEPDQLRCCVDDRRPRCCAALRLRGEALEDLVAPSAPCGRRGGSCPPAGPRAGRCTSTRDAVAVRRRPRARARRGRRSRLLAAGRQLGAGRRCRARRPRRPARRPARCTPTAAVVEVGVHRVGQVAALDEAAERGGELGPVRHQRRRVERALGGEADERGDGGADALDRAGPGLELLDVDAGGQVLGHATSRSGVRWGCCRGGAAGRAAEGKETTRPAAVRTSRR